LAVTEPVWSSLCCSAPDETRQGGSHWLEALLQRNRDTAYLASFGRPASREAFRANVPVCDYQDLIPWLDRMEAGETDVLFAGRPVAYELTGGSSGGSKLIPYSAKGLGDFQRAILPWLARTLARHDIRGKVYFSISPAGREQQFRGGVPVGLPDGAYLGETAGAVLARMTAVPFSVAAIRDLGAWREQTLACLRAAEDLELISVWSPTFLLQLLGEVGDTRALWPRLKVISCWASGPSRRYLEPLRSLFPHAVIEPKGLLSTEGVVTVPDAEGRPALTPHGFFEFDDGERLLLADELTPGAEYQVVITTVSGLYRYRTGDRVRCDGTNAQGRPVLEFIGRDSLTCDLVGEKLTEAFVARCLQDWQGFALIVPDACRPGYVLVCEGECPPPELARLDERLGANPQYAYARRLGQLAPLRALHHPAPFAVFERVLHGRGVRLGDIKPTSLRAEEFWLPLFEENRP
jgi:hypothetical protein